MNDKLIEAQDLQALNPERRPLSPSISFEVRAGDALLWSGDNGSGKSTLLKSLLGLHPFVKGRCRFFCPMSQVQYLPQLSHLHFHIPLSLRDMLPMATDSTLLKNLDLQKKWNTASGGERQKVLLTAALLKQPRVLILDEPFNHIDRESARLLEKSLLEFLKNSPQSAVIMVSHRPLVQQWPSLRTLEIR